MSHGYAGHQLNYYCVELSCCCFAGHLPDVASILGRSLELTCAEPVPEPLPASFTDMQTQYSLAFFCYNFNKLTYLLTVSLMQQQNGHRLKPSTAHMQKSQAV